MNLEEELLIGLKSPEPSFRLNSIELALREGESQRVLQILSEHQKLEHNEECKLLLEHAIDAVSRRLHPPNATPAPVAEELEPKTFFQKFDVADPPGRLRLIAEIKKKKVAEFAPHFMAIFQSEKHPLVAAEIIKTFGLHWPKETLRPLIMKLGSPHLSLRLASLEVLVKRIPHELSNSLPKLLVSNDPRIRGLAIRGLAAIDLDEALSHNEYLLTSPNIHDKIVGIENSFYFPFERVKPMLLRALARENDPTILTKIGSLFAINPDIEIPYRLWEMVDISSPEKSGLIRTFISDACTALEKSGRLSGAEFQKYLANLSAWAQKRYATRFVQDCVSQLTVEEECTPEIEALIIKNIDLPYVRQAFKEAINWPIKPKIRELILKYLDKPEAQNSTPQSTIGTSDLRQQIQKIAMLHNADRKTARTEIQKVLESEFSQPQLISTAFKTAKWLDLPDFVPLAKKYLDSLNSSILPAVIEYLNFFGYEEIAPHLERYLAEGELKVKVAAIKAMKKKNPELALNTLRAMLNNPDPKYSRSALACMVHMDFSLIRNTLLEYALSDPPTDLFDDTMCIFAANPEPENLFQLYRLQKLLPKERAEKVQEVIERTEELLIKNGQLTANEISLRKKKFEETLAEEERKEREAPAPYSLKALKPETVKEDLWRGKIEQITEDKEKRLTKRLLLVSVIIIIVVSTLHVLGVFGLFTWGIKPKLFKGRIAENIPGEGKILITNEGKRILILSGKSNSKIDKYAIGETFNGFLIPIRTASDGTIIARFHSTDAN